MNEARLVLQAIFDRLASEPVDVASPLSLDDDDVVRLLSDKVELRVEVHHDEGAHPAIAHAHVLATIGDHEPLDACVVAVHADRAAGLAGVGHTFCDLVAGPILSLVHARPVLGATPFDRDRGGDGLRGCHGFVGPRAVRWLTDDTADPVDALPSFEFADALAPPRLVHLAKAVLDLQEDGRIARTLEVDGHAASHVDPVWRTGPPMQKRAMGLHFAVFHLADQPDVVRAQRATDEAIEAFVEHFAATRDRDAAATRLAASGVDPMLVHELRLFVPAAFARLTTDQLPLSKTFTRVRADGWTDEHVPFLGERAFARTLVLGQRRIERDGVGLARQLALTSSEVGAINHALDQGTAFGDIQPLPPLIPDPDVPFETLERVARRLYGG